MRHFATESGKSKGQFYTPAEVSRVMAKVIGIGNANGASQTIHDPTCGSGSLLLKAHDEAKSRTGLDLALYGQEMDNVTAALARMNMILHDCPTAEIWKDNVLPNPHFKANDGKLKTFDYVVANPPFSFKAWSNGFNPSDDEFHRFDFGVPPTKNGDYAFLLHVLACLKTTGKAAVNLPHGVLFRGGSEAVIRREIVKRGYIKGVIGLPPNLFYGTGIPACIVVVDKENAHARKGIFMVDASKGFIKDGNKNRLRAQDIHKIVDIFNRQIELAHYSRLVPLAEISNSKNDYNLNVPRYIDGSDPEDAQDINAHLRGGIPDQNIEALNPYWQVLPSLREKLFEPAGRLGYSRLKLPVSEINSTIFGHAEFRAFNASVMALFSKWKAISTPRLKSTKPGDKPKALIEKLSEDLLETFRAARLLDAYDIYQHIMNYWDATMQDDVDFLAREGWKGIFQGAPNFDLIPPSLVIHRYFPEQQAALDKLETERDAITRKIEELDEEHRGEDALLADARNDKGKLTKAGARFRLSEIKSDREYTDERTLIKVYLALVEAEAAATKALKKAQTALDALVDAKYGKLSVDEIKTLIIDDKWISSLDAAVQDEMDRVSHKLAQRIKELADRYEFSLPQILKRVAVLNGAVDGHLKLMGYTW